VTVDASTATSAGPGAAPSAATSAALERAASGLLTIDDAELLLGSRGRDLDALLDLAGAMRDAGDPRRIITYSRKVFLPITTLCRDRCHYCVFVDTPGKLARKHKPEYMSPEQILAVARQGQALGCKEALFTLGDRPEDRWPEARAWLDAHGYASTAHYLRAMAQLVLDETGLLPHMNPGVMLPEEIELLRPVAPSMGMMLETTSRRLFEEPGQVHYGSPDKDPDVRLKVLEDAGRARVPLTTGILVGIGETLRDRAESLFAIRASHERHGHVQETIVQNFRAKDATAMQGAEDLGTAEYAAAIAVARLVMGPDAVVQAPPNLADPTELGLLIRAGLSDWGGVSPLTADHVNPERPWPQIAELAAQTAASGYELRERLTSHPRYLADADEWIDPALHGFVARLAGPDLLAAETVSAAATRGGAGPRALTAGVRGALERAASEPLSLTDDDLTMLLGARGAELDALATIASDLRRYTVGEAVSIVVNRNLSTDTRGLTLDDIERIAADAWELGATELCAQGRSPLDYLEIARAVKRAAPGIHLHAFRPTDVLHGAARAHTTAANWLEQLRDAGVDSVPGTGVKAGDRPMRPGIDLPAEHWASTIEAAHRAGLRSTSVVFYGGGESRADLVAHLRMLRAIQLETGGFTETVPMPFPDADLTSDHHRAMHAVTRLALHGSIPHVQVAWTRLDRADVQAALQSGADDLGGTLLDGRVRPDAGIEQGRELPLAEAAALTRHLSRPLRQRTTLYGEPPAERKGAAAPALRAAS
jgi:FO synthase